MGPILTMIMLLKIRENPQVSERNIWIHRSNCHSSTILGRPKMKENPNFTKCASVAQWGAFLIRPNKGLVKKVKIWRMRILSLRKLGRDVKHPIYYLNHSHGTVKEDLWAQRVSEVKYWDPESSQSNAANNLGENHLLIMLNRNILQTKDPS